MTKKLVFIILLATCTIGATFFVGALLTPNYAKLGLIASIVMAVGLGVGYLLGGPKQPPKKAS